MAKLILPHTGPQPTEEIQRARRKVAENLDLLADWLDDQAESASDTGQSAELHAGASTMRLFAAEVLPRHREV